MEELNNWVLWIYIQQELIDCPPGTPLQELKTSDQGKIWNGVDVIDRSTWSTMLEH